jgi:phosphoribosylformylglycinamidine synthase subunit PurL
LKKSLQREPNGLEKDIVGAEWSEHCSYKSTKRYIRSLPTEGERVILGPGYDAAVVDVGNNFVIAIHVESHNHPSAVEPYGGAATGVGGVIRDIISMGTRPIAILNSLRFGPIEKKDKKYSPKSKWLFANVIRGIGDYGNCIGVPTVGGEIEFDESFEDYCLVDVASIGIGKLNRIVSNRANVNDNIILVGGLTGKDGIHGASFASKQLEENNRSAIQVPDPFLEKILLEATLEAVNQGCINAIKDLGGGGLCCCLSEISDNLNKGFDIELTKIRVKDKKMSATEIMLSESQERMLYIVSNSSIKKLKSILDKFEVGFSIIGKVMKHHNLVLRYKDKIVANLPSKIVAHAPLINRKVQQPRYLAKLRKIASPPVPENLNETVVHMLSNPTIASKEWVYRQFDHEVGLRTVIKPGYGDAAVLRIDNGKFLSVKLDGNSKQCYLDPYNGTLGCLSESLRNIISTGANPIGIIDHLQFGSPEDREVFWTFSQSVKAIKDYCTKMRLPVLGGKVSLYNEVSRRPIKPSPVIGAIGLIEDLLHPLKYSLGTDNRLFLIGFTYEEMGGSEYFEYQHNIIGGDVPNVNIETDRLNGEATLELIKSGLVTCVQDCSKGGLAIALSKMAMHSVGGLKVNLDLIPSSCSRIDTLLFSESNSRYIIGTDDPEALRKVLKGMSIPFFAEIGNCYNNNDLVLADSRDKVLVNLSLDHLTKAFKRLGELMSGKRFSDPFKQT